MKKIRKIRILDLCSSHFEYIAVRQHTWNCSCDQHCSQHTCFYSAPIINVFSNYGCHISSSSSIDMIVYSSRYSAVGADRKTPLHTLHYFHVDSFHFKSDVVSSPLIWVESLSISWDDHNLPSDSVNRHVSTVWQLAAFEGRLWSHHSVNDMLHGLLLCTFADSWFN